MRVAIGSKMKKEGLLMHMQDQNVTLAIARKALQTLIRRGVFEEAENGSVKRLA